MLLNQNKQDAINFKQQLFSHFIRSLKLLLGNNRALTLLKAIIRQLPYRYAFPLTWVCLTEFPEKSVSAEQWQYGRPRKFIKTQIKVNPQCLSSRFFAISGYFEEALTQEILKPQRSGLLVDIGANYGYYSILWLQKPNTRAIAVEPVSEYVNLLHENLKPYPTRFQVFHGCVGDYDGVALLDTCGDPTMLSHVVNEDPQGKARQVSMTTLMSLLKHYQEEKIDVLKIDAEGYDIKILESCKNLFQEKRIKTVFWETAKGSEFSIYADSEKNMVEFLESLGYQKIISGYITGYQYP